MQIVNRWMDRANVKSAEPPVAIKKRLPGFRCDRKKPSSSRRPRVQFTAEEPGTEPARRRHHPVPGYEALAGVHRAGLEAWSSVRYLSRHLPPSIPRAHSSGSDPSHQTILDFHAHVPTSTRYDPTDSSADRHQSLLLATSRQNRAIGQAMVSKDTSVRLEDREPDMSIPSSLARASIGRQLGLC